MPAQLLPYAMCLGLITEDVLHQDVSFWLPKEGFTENNLCEVVRGEAGDIVESVALVDAFTHPKTGKTSNCFRIAYRSMERSLTDDEINKLQVWCLAMLASALQLCLFLCHFDAQWRAGACARRSMSICQHEPLPARSCTMLLNPVMLSCWPAVWANMWLHVCLGWSASHAARQAGS